MRSFGGARRRVMRVVAGTVAGVTIAALSGCATTGTSASGSVGTATATITARFSADPKSFDPATLVGADDFYASRLLFDTLLRTDDDGNIIAGLANDWDLGATGGTLTLRDGATCSDGTAIDADVVVNSLKRIIDPDTSSSMKSLIFGTGDVTITATDDKTVDIELSSGFSELENGLAMVGSGIVCPAGVADPTGLAAGSVSAAFSGPYTLDEVKPGIEYEFTLRDGYEDWAEPLTELNGNPAKTILFSVGTDTNTNANEVLAGSLDVGKISASSLSQFSNVAKVIIGEQYVLFNESDSSPFKDPALRKAVAQLVNPDDYNQISDAGQSEVEYTFGNSSMQCVNTDTSLLQTYDPDSVKESGILNGVKIKYVASNAFGPNGAGSDYLYEQLKSAGADVDYQKLDNSSAASIQLGKDSSAWDITIFGTVNNTNTLWTSVTRVLGTTVEDGGRNIVRSVNPDGEALAAKVMSSSTTEEKCENYQALQENILDRVDFVPLTANMVYYALGDNISYDPPSSRQDFSALRVVGE